MKINISKKRNRRPGKIYLLFPVLLVVFGVYHLVSGSVLTKNVECFTQYGQCPEMYMGELVWVNGTPLLRPLPGEKIENSLKKYVEIKEVSLYRRLPKTLVVSVVLRKPLGTVGPEVLGAKYISDEEGVILGESESRVLPFLIYQSGLKTGDRIPADHVKALELLGRVSQLTGEPVSGQFKNTDLEVFLPADQKVLLNPSHLSSNWYATLQVILDRSKIHSKIPKVIDLRYSDPIITF